MMKNARLALLVGFVTMALVLVGARLVQLSLVDGQRLARLAERQHLGTVDSRPRRGAIVDRSGEPLALAVDVDSIFVRPHELSGDERGFALARRLGISRDAWIRKASSTAPFVWLMRQASPTQLAVLEEASVPGVGTLPEHRRLYPHGRLAANVIGLAGIDSQGLEGVELAYDELLAGRRHRVGVQRDALGRPIFGLRAGEPPREGADVTLTLDLGLQYVAERALAEKVEATRARGGLVVAMDPRTGEILALAQSPGFDPNRIGTVDPTALRNRAVADAFEPGSTMKAFLAAAALEEGVVAPVDRIFCENGSYRVGGRTIHDHDPFAWLSFTEVLTRSSNIGTSKVGLLLGAERYAHHLADFGFGQRTGVDLPGEQAGILRPAEAWRTIDIATASFGQGVSVTPIQLVTAFATLANGGYRMKPFVVRRVTSSEGEVLVENQPTIVRRVIREKTAAQVLGILEGVVSPNGTGGKAAVTGLRIAGKTGTAQKVDPVRGGYSSGRIASFVGIFPAQDPALVVLVVVDEPRGVPYGGVVAAPVFREIAVEAVERFHLSTAELDAGELPTRGNGVRPIARPADGDRRGFVGLSLREALREARSRGIEVEITGSGYVVREETSGGVLRLELRPPTRPLS